VNRSPLLTRSGTALAVGAVLLAVLSVVSGYRELLVLALAGFAVLAAAVLLPRLATPVVLERRVPARMVQRGDQLNVSLYVTSSAPVGGLRVLDRLGSVDVPIDIPTIGRGETLAVTYRLEARHRGPQTFGPILEERTDPLGLAVRSIAHDVLDEVLVHPVVHPLRGRIEGLHRQARVAKQRKVTDDPVADFRSLRGYQLGDDPRFIHWASSARTGQLVVRDFVEQRHATRIVLLDTSDRAITAPSFEEAAEIAVSLACDGIDGGLAVIVRTSDSAATGTAAPVRDRDSVLELFARVQRTSDADTTPMGRIVSGLPYADQVYLVSGRDSIMVRTLLGVSRLRPHAVVVRVVPANTAFSRLAATTVDVHTAEQFVMRWKAGRAS
jgi:uncharacterized protein (DUF58 family)